MKMKIPHSDLTEKFPTPIFLCPVVVSSEFISTPGGQKHMCLTIAGIEFVAFEAQSHYDYP